jgi:Bacterial SH3 domain
MTRCARIVAGVVALACCLVWLAASAQPAHAVERKKKAQHLTAWKNLKIYAKPSTEAEIVGRVKKGARLIVVRTKGDFAKVRTPNGRIKGWIKRRPASAAAKPAGVGGAAAAESVTQPDRSRTGDSKRKQKKKQVAKKKQAGKQATKRKQEQQPSLKKSEKPKPAPEPKLKQKKKDEPGGGSSSSGKPADECPWQLSAAGGVAIPFMEVYTGYVEGRMSRRLATAGPVTIAVSAAVAYGPLDPNTPRGDKDPELEGTWVPVYAGLEIALGRSALRPYVGVGVGGSFYDFRVIPQETDLELPAAADKTDRRGDPVPYEVNEFGFGGRGLAGLALSAGQVDVFVEAQGHGAQVADGFAFTPVFVAGLGLRF